MPSAQVVFGGSVVGRIAFESEHVHSTGGPDFPRLHLAITIAVTARTTVANNIPTIWPTTWISLAGDLRLSQDKVISSFRDDVGLYAESQQKESATQVHLALPITLLDVYHIEQTRSDNFQAALWFRPLLGFHGKSKGVQWFETATVQPMGFTIPKSRWLGLLEQIGYGRFEMFEVRIGDVARNELNQAVGQLRKAKEHLVSGEWNTAVAHCRIALEAIVGSKNIPVSDTARFRARVESFVAGYLSSKVQPEHAKLLIDEFLGIWSATSRAVHPAVPDYFKRRDAVFLYHKLGGLVEYVSRILVE
jgi:hypothetical protein